MKKRDLLLLLLAVLLVSNVGTHLITRSFYDAPEAPFDPVVEVNAEREEASLLWEVWDLLEREYYEPLDAEKLIEGAVEGMLDSLDDPHTRYLSPESLEDMLIHTMGSFDGIGVEITEDEGEVLVLRVFEGSPAEKGGLLEGDRIIEVEGTPTTEMTLDEAARNLRGPSGTEVEITIRRAGEESFELTLVRADIEIKTVHARMLENRIGYIEITNFDQNTAEDLNRTLQDLEGRGLNGLVLDLRDNPGGLLEEAIEVGKKIVPAGEITRTVDRDGNVLQRYYSEATPEDYPMAVLVNEYTASAAEIVAGALQDSGRAKLIGEPTYGKATVQYLQHLEGGGGLRYTIAKYLTPKGHDLGRESLKPDEKVGLPEEYFLQFRSIPGKLEEGNTGEKVVLLQEIMDFLGYELEVTGVFDEQTMTALRNFQEDHGLSATGLPDEAMREALRKTLSERATEVDEQLNRAVDQVKGL